MATIIQAADIIEIQDKYYLETGRELSFKEAVAIWKERRAGNGKS